MGECVCERERGGEREREKLRVVGEMYTCMYAHGHSHNYMSTEE